MRRRPIRRPQIIAPFGPGAMVVAPDGTVLLGGGLDHWYEPTNPGRQRVDLLDFKFSEWRLERELALDHLRLPPDYRERRQQSWADEEPNTGLTIPFLRFPQWHVCPRCDGLEKFTLSRRETPR